MTTPQILTVAGVFGFLLFLIWAQCGGLRWFKNTVSKIYDVLKHGEVSGAPPPRQPFRSPAWNPFPGVPRYELYKDTRARLEAEARRRGDRQWTLMTWISGIFTAIIGGIIVSVADGAKLELPVQIAISLWVLFAGGCAIVRILHDNVIKSYHVKACQQMDDHFGLHFDDSAHKIDLKQHHLFMEIILILGLGVLFSTWGWNLFAPDDKEADAQPKCACCCKAPPKPKAGDANEDKPKADEVKSPPATKEAVIEAKPMSKGESPAPPTAKPDDNVTTPAPDKATTASSAVPDKTKN